MYVHILVFGQKGDGDERRRRVIVDSLGEDAVERHTKLLGEGWTLEENYSFGEVDKVERHHNYRLLGLVLTNLEILPEEDAQAFAKYMGIQTNVRGALLLDWLKTAAASFSESELQKANQFLNDTTAKILVRLDLAQ